MYLSTCQQLGIPSRYQRNSQTSYIKALNEHHYHRILRDTKFFRKDPSALYCTILNGQTFQVKRYNFLETKFFYIVKRILKSVLKKILLLSGFTFHFHYFTHVQLYESTIKRNILEANLSIVRKRGNIRYVDK